MTNWKGEDQSEEKTYLEWWVGLQCKQGQWLLIAGSSNRLYLCPDMNTERELEMQIEIQLSYILFANCWNWT